MATGAETAGLVLAAFPLALTAIKAYAEGIQTMKDMVKYREVLDIFELEISMEDFFFRQTLETLLQGKLQPSEIDRLMKDTGGKLWKSNNVQVELQAWMHDDGAVMLFLRTAELLDRTLREVAEKFPQPVGTTSKTLRYRQALLAWKSGMLATYRQTQIERIRMLNIKLQQFISMSSVGYEYPLIIGQGNNNKAFLAKAVQQYKRVQSHAKALYQIFQEHFQPPVCACPTPHHANLQLELQSTTGFCAAPKSHSDPKLLFKVMFSIEDLRVKPSTWRELQFEHIHPVEIPQLPKEVPEVVSYITQERGPEQALGTFIPPGDAFEDDEKIIFLSKNAIATPLSSVSRSNPTKTSVRNPSHPRMASRFSKHTQPERPPAENSTSKSKLPAVKGRKSKFVSWSQPNPGKTINDENKVPAPPAELIYKADNYNKATFTTIDRFCTTIRSATDIHCCLGILSAKSNPALLTRVWVPKEHSLYICPAEVVSLESLLTSRPLPKPSLKSRITVGLKLASSVMQLHSTAWLNDFWSASDIWFQNLEAPIEHILATPLVHRAFSRPDKPPTLQCAENPQDSLWRVLAPNESLLSLGIILIELLKWKSLASLQKKFSIPLDPSGDDKINRFIAAKGIMEHLETQYADCDPYFNAARRCIDGLDHPGKKTLDRDDFKKEVYNLVVRPLERYFMQGWGSSEDTKSRNLTE
ncbi:hypothetical protein BDZ91DRAFT_794718 [Kalaharituber pfeilii]|nr:hypothetical protein BDZ91DRAFT_794718 [Kalaharituber pfeilii]